jgi:hypothetical protein
VNFYFYYSLKSLSSFRDHFHFSRILSIVLKALIVPRSLEDSAVQMAFVNQQVPFSCLSCPFPVVMELVEADAHSVIFEKDDSLDGRVSIVIVETLCLNFVDKVSSFGEIFHFQVPSVYSGRRPNLYFHFPLSHHQSINVLAALIVA